MNRFANKVAVVTGAASGLGAAISVSSRSILSVINYHTLFRHVLHARAPD